MGLISREMPASFWLQGLRVYGRSAGTVGPLNTLTRSFAAFRSARKVILSATSIWMRV